MILALLWACATTPPTVSEAVIDPVPVPGDLPEWSPPAPVVSDLPNGSSLWLLQEDSVPLVSIRIVFPGGSALDPEKAPGAMWMAALMMEESAGERDSMAMTKAFELLAASASIDVDRQSVIVSLDVARDRLDEGLALVADQLMRPAFDREDWERVQYQQILTLGQAREEGSELAMELAQSLYFGSSVGGRPPEGTPEGIRVLSLESVKAAYLEQVRPKGASFVVVGDVDVEGLTERLLAPFEGWEGEIPAPPKQGPPDGVPGLYLVDDPGSSQTAIRVLGLGPKAGHVDRLAAEATAVVIGGSFTSRLNYLMREKKGYTYGAWAAFSGERDVGLFYAGSSVRQDATAEALSDMLGVFTAAAGPYSAEEEKKARTQLFSEEVGRVESIGGLADTYAERIGDGLRPGGWAKELSLAMSSTATDMQVIGKRFIHPESLTVVLAGDLDVISPALKAAGYESTVVEPRP